MQSQHHRFAIWNSQQHPFKHPLSDFAYTHDALPGITNVQSAMNWILAVLYPQTQDAVANVAALPAVGNTINDYRVVLDDGDGKAASYRWEQREGEAAASWHKIYDMDWGADSILESFYTQTQGLYAFKGGQDDLDELGAAITGVFAGQRIYGGHSANTNLTLSANSGDGVGAQTGYVQFTDHVRATTDNTYDLGVASYTFRTGRFGTSVIAGTLTAAAGSITDSSGAISFDNENLSTTGTLASGTLTVSADMVVATGSITSASGAITFGNENLSTTGTLASGTLTVSADLVVATGSITSASGAISFGDENLSTTGTLGAGAITGTQVNADNLRLDGNTLSATNLNGGIVIVANGSGVIDMQSAMTTLGQTVTGTLGVTGQLNADNLRMDGNVLSSTNTDGDITLTPNGTGSIVASSLIKPGADNTVDLAVAATRFRTLYLGTGIHDGTNSIAIATLLSFRDALVGASSGMSLFYDGSKWNASVPDTEVTHSTLSGLTTSDAGHTQFVMLAGRSGGQTIQGGTAGGEHLVLESTANASKGLIKVKQALVPDSTAAYAGGWTGTDLGGSSNYFNDLYMRGEAKNLRLENFATASVPAFSGQNIGRVMWDTDLSLVKVDTGGAITTLVDLTASQSLTTKNVGLQDGSVSAPSLSFTSDANNGLYYISTDKWGASAGGYLALELTKSTGNYANLGIGGASGSSSDNYPLLIERSNVSSGTIVQISNPDSSASSKASIQLSTQGGTNLGEISVFTSSTALHAYADAMTIRPSDGTGKLSLIGGDTAGGHIAVYTGGDYAATGEAIRINADKSLQFMQEIATPATPDSNTSKMYFKSDGKPYYLGDDGVERRFGSGAGGINYVDSSDGSGTTGWVTYDDAAATPVNLVDGTFGGTFASSTSDPLRETNSFLMSSAAQGEGVAYTITPHPADYGHVLEISFDFAYTNASAAEGDYTVWVYDVTNSQLIQPTPYKLPSGVTGQYYKWKGTFQTSMTGVTYRVAIHCAATTSAYLKFDNVVVGPQVKSYGPQVSDWIAYTPTGAWAANTTYTGFWRRVGDQIEVKALAATSGAPTSAVITFSLPSGLSFDTAKMLGASALERLGKAAINDSGTYYYGDVWYSSTTAVTVVNAGASGTYVNVPSYVDQATPFTFGAGDYVAIEFKAPISGWSSGQLLSSDAETRVVSALYSGVATGTLNGSFNTLTVPTKVVDTHSAYSSGTYSVPVPGYYDISATFETSHASIAAQQYAGISIFVDGVEKYTNYDYADSTSGIYLNPLVSVKSVWLTAGQAITIRGISTGTTPSYAGATRTYFSIAKVSGPSQIAASEKVYAIYTTATAGSYANSAENVIDFGTKVQDSHGAVTTGGSWAFTAPRAGIYNISAFVGLGGSGFTGTWDINVYITGVKKAGFHHTVEATGGFNQTVGGPFAWYLLAGDTVQVKFRNDTGGARSLNANAFDNIVTIVSG